MGKIILFLSILFFPFTVFGATLDSYAESNADDFQQLFTGSVTTVAQSFEVSASYLITSTSLYLEREGTLSGNVVVKIYAHTGTYGTSSVPTGSVLATSDSVVQSTLSTTPSLVDFTFSGAQQIELSAGYYVLVVEPDTLGADTANCLRVHKDASSPTHAGNFSYWVSSWVAVNGNDNVFYVSGTPAPTPTPTPTVSLVADSGCPNASGSYDPYACLTADGASLSSIGYVLIFLLGVLGMVYVLRR